MNHNPASFSFQRSLPEETLPSLHLNVYLHLELNIYSFFFNKEGSAESSNIFKMTFQGNISRAAHFEGKVILKIKKSQAFCEYDGKYIDAIME